MWLARAAVPESRDPGTDGRDLDVAGAVTAVVGLGALTQGLIALGDGGGRGAAAWLATGAVGLVAFVVVERRSDSPLVPPTLFADRVFTVANLLTFVAYAAIGGVFLLVTVALRLLLGFGGLAAGAGTLPVTGLMLLLSARSGRRAARVGPRQQLVLGPALLGVASLWLAALDRGDAHLTDALPPLVVFGLGLSAMVAPVTATVLEAAPRSRAGVASGVNNAVARTAGLLSVAVLPVAAGLGPPAFEDPGAFEAGRRWRSRPDSRSPGRSSRSSACRAAPRRLVPTRAHHRRPTTDGTATTRTATSGARRSRTTDRDATASGRDHVPRRRVAGRPGRPLVTVPAGSCP